MNNSMKASYRWVLPFILLLLVGCIRLPATEEIKIVSTSPVPTSPEVTPIPTKILQTSIPSTSTCLFNQDISLTLQESDMGTWNEQIMIFILEGGDPGRISQAPLSSAENSIELNTFDEIDINGDHIRDFVITAAYGWPIGQQQSGILMVFTCENGRYIPQITFSSNEEWGVPSIKYQGDMNGDGVDDILTTQEHCGAHTCNLNAQFFTWTGSSVEDRFIGNLDKLPYPAVEVLGPTGEGLFETQFTGQGYGSVGAGPYRERTLLYSWSEDDFAYVLSSDLLTAPMFRIHMLHDADTALFNGDTATAIDGFERVINDDSLNEWMGGKEERISLAAFASYRILLIDLVTGELENASANYEIMQKKYEAQNSGAAYVYLAAESLEAFRQTNDLSDACQGIRNYILEHEDEILTPLYFGYANPAYSPADICPF